MSTQLKPARDKPRQRGATTDPARATLKQEALAHHRDGDLAAARAGYAALLRLAPDDPDLLGLSGILALQQGKHDAAEQALRRALESGSATPVFLRNLNALLVLLLQTRRNAEAKELIAGGVPDWAEQRVPDAAEAETVLSLAEALVRLSAPDAALSLLRGAFAGGDHDARVQALTGRAQTAAGDHADAVACFERAVALAPEVPEHRIELGLALRAFGRQEQAAQADAAFLRDFQLYAAPVQPDQTATILVINATARRSPQSGSGLAHVHFQANYISQIATQIAGTYRFLSVFPSADMDRLAERIPPVDMVFNNLATPETRMGTAERRGILALIDKLGAPVVNHPDDLAATTRDRVAAALGDCPGIHMPRTTRITLPAPSIAAARSIAEGLEFPVILRAPTAHSASNAAFSGKPVKVILAHDAEAFANWVGMCGIKDFYAISYVDLERPGGIYRKLRALVAGDDILIHSASYFSHWLVGGWRAGAPAEDFYAAHPECIDEGSAIVRDPDRHLGPDCMAALRQLRSRIPLEFFGVDFDIDAQGNLVVFEVSPAMIFLPATRIAEKLVPLATPKATVNAAFERMVRARLRK